MKKYLEMSSAAIVTGALRVKAEVRGYFYRKAQGKILMF